MVKVNNRDKIEWSKGMTVQDVLNQMKYTYSLITVSVNGKLVLKEDYNSHEVPDESDVKVFHLAHGG